MPTPVTWIDAARRYQQQRREQERISRERAGEVKETTLGYIVDADELCAECREKVMRP